MELDKKWVCYLLKSVDSNKKIFPGKKINKTIIILNNVNKKFLKRLEFVIDL